MIDVLDDLACERRAICPSSARPRAPARRRHCASGADWSAVSRFEVK
jgi:hypothetical protein